MKEYNKPFIEDEYIEIDDVIATSQDINDRDAFDPFDITI